MSTWQHIYVMLIFAGSMGVAAWAGIGYAKIAEFTEDQKFLKQKEYWDYIAGIRPPRTNPSSSMWSDR